MCTPASASARSSSRAARRAGGRARRARPGADLDDLVDRLVGPVHYRVLVTGDPVPGEFTDALVAAVLAGLPAGPRS
ncbi:TetR-like C-terminal domain-containing protein [Pseudonocardia humida]|uniref:TetR-like C-terminal domain-containing protein n=1 Tax=Pseudonocardia humida TaxID=2800819 RepID=UPI0021135A88